MIDLLALIDKLGGIGSIGFGSTMILITIGSYKRVWVWGSELNAQCALTAKAEATASKWEAAYLSTVGLAETTAAIAKARA